MMNSLKNTYILTFETAYENINEITNVTKEIEITIKYNPLYQQTKNYVDYAGKENYTYDIIIINEETGEQYDNTYDNEVIEVYKNNILYDEIIIHMI